MTTEQIQEIQRITQRFEQSISNILRCEVHGYYKIANKPTKKIPLSEIVETVAQVFDVSVEDLLSKSRKRILSDARAMISHIAYSHMREHRYSLNAIAKAIGRSDHSSVIAARNRFIDLIANENWLVRKLNKAVELIDKKN